MFYRKPEEMFPDTNVGSISLWDDASADHFHNIQYKAYGCETLI